MGGILATKLAIYLMVLFRIFTCHFASLKKHFSHIWVVQWVERLVGADSLSTTNAAVGGHANWLAMLFPVCQMGDPQHITMVSMLSKRYKECFCSVDGGVSYYIYNAAS